MYFWTAHYDFQQPFSFPAAAAYQWCVDYQPDDLARMADRGHRGVRWMSPDLVLLTDRIIDGGSTVIKRKLVHLMADRLSWTSTHLLGPTRLSQFLYEIHSRGKSESYLAFIGLQVEHRAARPTPTATRALARRIRTEDSATWRKLARSMALDLG